MTFLANGPWYLDPVFLPAAAGLFGVLVGGLITAFSTYLLDEKRAERDREREDRVHSTELRRAALLIDADLGHAIGHVDLAVKNNRWWPSEDNPLHLPAWDEHRAVIAVPEMPYVDWCVLESARNQIGTLNAARTMAAQELGADKTWPAMPEYQKPIIEKIEEVLKKARGALARFIGDLPRKE